MKSIAAPLNVFIVLKNCLAVFALRIAERTLGADRNTVRLSQSPKTSENNSLDFGDFNVMLAKENSWLIQESVELRKQIETK
jgi:hypothetical protein